MPKYEYLVFRKETCLMTRSMDKIVALCKRRGFIFQNSEIYGGQNGFWDYGPLGTELKRNVRDVWYHDMVSAHNELVQPAGAPATFQMVGLESALIMHPQVWKCSGHYDLFHDMMVDCHTCKGRFRQDHIPNTPCPQKPSKMVGDHTGCKLTEPREFNLMMKRDRNFCVNSLRTFMNYWSAPNRNNPHLP